jgi:glycosyltransferase involved in cell wall biosynthesis
VTVVIPAFNAEDFVESAIRSVTAQTYGLLEVIVVVEDGSTDATNERAATVSDSRVRVIHTANAGRSEARNRGVAEASGEILAFLDADDEWEPEKLADQLPVLSDSVAVGGRMRYVSVNGRTLGTAGESTEGHMDDIRKAAFMPFPISSMITRTETVRKVGGFDTALPEAEDLDLLQRLAMLGRVTTVDCVVGSYRIHRSSASVRGYFRTKEVTRFLQARIETEGLSWTDFHREYRRSARMACSDTAGYLYRSGGLAFAEGRRIRATIFLAGALILYPGYVLRRLARQRCRATRAS